MATSISIATPISCVDTTLCMCMSSCISTFVATEIYVIRIWNTYHLHTSEIIRTSDFVPL